jgi:gliding motility-associated-like protein
VIKIKVFLFIIFNLFCLVGFSQLNLNTGMTPAQMVQNVLLGSGVTVSNITYTGGAISRASFTNGNTTNIGLTSGLVLCTGNVSQINNPASVLMSNNLGLSGDGDLNNINNGCLTYDACILQFDFVPLSDTVKFRYVFGSEEYPKYVCAVYNDIFAFFISGPNPAGGNYSNYNIALIPGTPLPVSVNSVNNGIIGSDAGSGDCTGIGQSLSYSSLYIDNAGINGPTISFGGFTTPLTAVCHVNPCQTYHIKIAIADGYNGLYDSGVFLEANSFTANTFSVNTSYSSVSFGDSAIEGCSNGIISFTLPSPATSPYVINYTLTGTATNGSDYNTLPGTITIPTGQDSVALIINPIFDGISENTETVIINYNNGCLPQSDTIFIANKNLLSLNASNDTTICIGASVNLTASPHEGIPPYTYSWNTSITINNISVTPNSNSVYTITVSDACSQSATESINILVNSVNTSISSTNEFCNQGNGSASIVASGVCNSAYSYFWNNALTTPNISNIGAGTYSVTVSCGNCSSTASTSVSNIPGPTVNLISSTNSDCGQNNGSISISVTGGALPYSYNWNTSPVQTTQDIQNIGPGSYSVTVTDLNNCSASLNCTINQNGGPVLVTSSSNEMCGQGNGTASVTASQGTGNYTYQWSTTPVQNTPAISDLPAGIYIITVDDGNCYTTANVTVGNTPGATASMFLNPVTTTLMDGPINFAGFSNGSISNWLWDFGDGQTASEQYTTHQYDNLGQYPISLVTTDINGCVDTAYGTINIVEIFTIYIPNSFTPDADGLNDVFQPQGLSIDPDNFEMLIFNRWGNLVFQTSKWGESWNGSKDNNGSYKDAIPAVYVYKIHLREEKGIDHDYYGKIILIK